MIYNKHVKLKMFKFQYLTLKKYLIDKFNCAKNNI